MNNANASDLERVVSDLGQIARTYTHASQEVEQHVITLEGAVSYVLSSGVTQWKGLSSEAFASAWLERRARLKQASLLMSESAGYLTTMARTIEDHLPLIRAEQSIQLEAIFASMGSSAQQSILDGESQAQNAIVMALAVLNSQLEALVEQVSDCPEVDREASYPGYYDTISRNDAGGGSVPGDGVEGDNSGSEPTGATPPLANGDQAQVDPAKFEKYSMDPDNPQNKGKWQAFQQLGYNIKDEEGRAEATQDVMTQLREELPNRPAILEKVTGYGPRFRVDIPIRGPNGNEGTLATIWQYDSNSINPRMITNWLEVHK